MFSNNTCFIKTSQHGLTINTAVKQGLLWNMVNIALIIESIFFSFDQRVCYIEL